MPQPGSPHLYYLFSPAAIEDDQLPGFRYSLVDLRRQNGLGEVVRRGQVLHASSTERVTAVPHRNNRDVWIIGHERDSDMFFAYLLTAQGLTTPRY